MKATRWADTAHYDLGLDTFEDGTAQVSFADLGIFFAVPEYFTVNGDKVQWRACGFECSLTLSDDGEKLIGTLTRDGEEPIETELCDTHGKPVRMDYHKYDGSPFSPDCFDKHFIVGKWYCEKLYRVTMNIIDTDGGLKVKLSFGDGFQNFPPLSVWCENGLLVWQINDAQNRGIAMLKRDGDTLIGSYSQIHHAEMSNIVFTKLSDTPDDGEYIAPKEYSHEERLAELRKFAAYSDEPEKIEHEYILGGKLPSVIAKSDFPDYIKDKDGDALAFACLNFVCDHFKHNGSSGMPKGRSAADIYGFCLKNDNAINCRGLAVMLASLLRYVEIRAAHVTCMPFEEPFSDCHVVCDVFMPSGGRSILDPTFRLCLYDKDGAYISLPELRSIMIAEGEIYPCREASYNGGAFDLSYYKRYMTKNTFYFSRGRINRDGLDESESLTLLPLGYEQKSNRGRIVRNREAFWGQ